MQAKSKREEWYCFKILKQKSDVLSHPQAVPLKMNKFTAKVTVLSLWISS